MEQVNKKTIITISGQPGSGKSSAAREVAANLGYQHFSSGDFMRNIALNKGVSLNDLSKIAETDQGQIDFAIDEELRNKGNESDLVIDSRLAFHWIPESFKVFLDLPLEISAERIWSNLKNNPLRQQSEKASSPEEVLVKIKERLESEHKRYLDLYQLDYTDLNNFDLVINTAEKNIKETQKTILEEYKKWLES